MAQDDDKAVEALLLNVHPTRRALLKRMLVAAGALALALPVSSAFAGAQGKGKGKGKGKKARRRRRQGQYRRDRSHVSEGLREYGEQTSALSHSRCCYLRRR